MSVLIGLLAILSYFVVGFLFGAVAARICWLASDQTWRDRDDADFLWVISILFWPLVLPVASFGWLAVRARNALDSWVYRD